MSGFSGVHGQFVGHVIRRGLEYTSSSSNDARPLEVQQWEDLKYDMPKWGAIVMYATAIGFMFLAFSVRYTVGHVIATLAMIESPATEAVAQTKVRFSDEPDATIEKAPLLEVEESVRFVPSKPITSNIRATIKHITSQGGFRMRWRGVGVGFVYDLLAFYLTALLVHIIPGPRAYTPIKASIAAGITGVALAKVHCVYTHVTITRPWNKTLRQYRKEHGAYISWKQLALPSFATAMVIESSAQLINVVCQYTKMEEFTSTWAAVAQVTGIIMLILFVVFVLAIPAMIRLRRIEASLLPEEIETLVPFDRSFGGRIEPTDITAKPVVRMVAAKKSFTCAQYRRVLGVYGKMVAMVMAITFVGVHAVALEAYFIMGDALKQLALAVHATAVQNGYKF